MGLLGLFTKKEVEQKVSEVKESFDIELKKQLNGQLNDAVANLMTSYQSTMYGWLNNGQPVQLGDNTFTYIEQGYQRNADVYACIDLILTKLAACTPVIYEVKKENIGSVQKYRNLLQSNTKDAFIKAKELEVKTLKETYLPGIAELLHTPNKYQTYSDWIKHYAGFYLLTGNSYNYYNGLPGQKVLKPREMYVLPAQFMQIISGGQFEPIKGYRVMNQRFFGSDMFDFDANTVSHLKTFNPYYSNYGTQLYGQSPLMAYRLTLQKNFDGRIEANKQMKNGGTSGILFPKGEGQTWTSEQAKDLKEQIQSLKQRSAGDLITRIFAAPRELGWQEIGLSPADMLILESLEFDRKDICNAFHVPITLLNNMDASTDNNVQMHAKQLIYNAIMPLANAISDRLTRDICPAYNTASTQYVIQLDCTTLPDMQDDMTNVADWLNTAWWLTPNQKLTAMGFSESKEPLADKILVPANYRLLEDLEMTDASFTGSFNDNPIDNGKKPKNGNDNLDNEEDL